MLLYSLTYFINAIGFFLSKKNNKIVFSIVVMLLVFMSGTRYYMGGSDVYVYENFYNNVPDIGYILKYIFFNGSGTLINTNYEIGFSVLCSIIKGFGFSYFGFIFIYSILFYTLMFKGLEEFVPNWAPFIALFMYKLMFYNTFISIRQGLTIALFCFSLPYLRDKKWHIYFPLSFIAFYIHRGALIMFPLYFINYVPISKKIIKYYAFLFLPTWFIRGSIDLSWLLIRLTTFIGNDHALSHWLDSTETISIIHTIECYVVVILILLYYNKIISYKKGKEAKLVLKLFLIAIPMFTLLSDWILFTREKDYFILMYGIIFSYIIESKTKSTVYKSGQAFTLSTSFKGTQSGKIIAVAILFVCFIGMIRYVLLFDGGAFINFESFIFKGISFFN